MKVDFTDFFKLLIFIAKTPSLSSICKCWLSSRFHKKCNNLIDKSPESNSISFNETSIFSGFCVIWDVLLNWTHPAPKNIYEPKTCREHPPESFIDKGQGEQHSYCCVVIIKLLQFLWNLLYMLHCCPFLVHMYFSQLLF